MRYGILKHRNGRCLNPPTPQTLCTLGANGVTYRFGYCPCSEVTPDVREFIAAADAFEEHHLPPLLAGWDDQAAQFLAAYSFWRNIVEETKALLKDRANGRQKRQ